MTKRKPKFKVGQRRFIVEWIGFAQRWERSFDAPGIYTKEDAVRLAESLRGAGLEYRARPLTRKEEGT